MKKKNILSIKDKTVIIFGASGLLGQEYVKYLLSQETTVIAVDKNINLLKKKIKKTKVNHNSLFFYKCDITNLINLKECRANLKRKVKNIDVIVNCAAIDAKFDDKFKAKQFNNLYNYPTKLWDLSLKVNLTGSLNIAKVFGEYFEKIKKGHIIFIGSNYGIVAPDNSIYNKNKNFEIYKPADYVVSKFGLIGLMKYLASYFRYKNIRINMITPCGIETNQKKSFVKKFSEKTLLDRMSKINEFNGALHFLCSDSSSYMTGSNVVIDGGWTVI